MSSVGLSTVLGAGVGFLLGALTFWWFLDPGGNLQNWSFDYRCQILIVWLLFVLLGAFIGFANEIGKR